jgi:hypothetical protein
MAKTALRPARASARAFAFVVPTLLVTVAALGGCAETSKSLGGTCIRDSDCLTGICTGFLCTASPPLLDAEVEVDSATVPDASPDVVGNDSSPPADAPTEAAPDGAGD